MTNPKSIARPEAPISRETKALLPVVEKHQILKLSIEDSEAFVEALLNPPEPNEVLKAASQRHKKLISVYWI
jgi:uncharacterized protein (DUF1778 family)